MARGFTIFCFHYTVAVGFFKVNSQEKKQHGNSTATGHSGGAD
jgi:hypothetical protein